MRLAGAVPASRQDGIGPVPGGPQFVLRDRPELVGLVSKVSIELVDLGSPVQLLGQRRRGGAICSDPPLWLG